MSINVSAVTPAILHGPLFTGVKRMLVPLSTCGRIALLAKILFKTILSLGFCCLTRSLKTDWAVYRAGGKYVLSNFSPISGPIPEDALDKIENPHLFDNEALRVLVEKRPNLVRLNLYRTRVNDEGIKHLNKLKHLRSVDFSYVGEDYRHGDPKLTGAGFAHLAGHPALERVILAHCIHINDECLSHISRLPKLQVLDFMCCYKITKAGFAELTNLKFLKELNLSCCIVHDDCLEVLKRIPSLESLNLMYCKQITDAGLQVLKTFTGLKALNLNGCEGVTASGLSHLKSLVLLEELSLYAFKGISAALLASFIPLKNLRVLDFTWTDITDDGVAHLRAFQKLESLSLYRCTKITDAGVHSLKGLPALTSLTLSFCNLITDKGLAYLKDLKSLQSLHLNGCNLSFKGMKDFKKLEKLRIAENESLTDALVAHVCEASQLRILEMYDCKKITDLSLAHLKNLKGLERLDLSGCRGLSNEGICSLVQLDTLKELWLNWLQVPKTTVEVLKAKGIKVYNF